MNGTERGLSYDDVLLKPQPSPVDSRSDVDLSMDISPNITLDVPVISAPMDTVTDNVMARAMAANGAAGFVHRFQDIDQQIEMIKQIPRNYPRVAVIGVDEGHARFHKIIEAVDIDAVCIDIAHGGLDKCARLVDTLHQEIRSMAFDIDIIAGNVATRSTAKKLFSAGADTVKVGVGPGSCCTTREVSGVGVPQITAISEVRTVASVGYRGDRYIIADGGMKTPGDAAKAIMAGADAVMLGSWFAGCPETPRGNEIRGLASEEFQEENGKSSVVEGEVQEVEEMDTVEKRVKEIADGLRSASSYCGGESLETARSNSEFIQATPNTVKRNGVH